MAETLTPLALLQYYAKDFYYKKYLRVENCRDSSPQRVICLTL